MDKLAQKRKIDWVNRLREDHDFIGKHVENQSSDYANLMNILREVDENVREIVVSDDNGGSFKSLLKVAKSNFNRREYLNAVIYLARFHDKFDSIKLEFSKLYKDLSNAHNQFLFGDLDAEQKEFLMNRMPEKFKKKEKKKVKKASIEEFLTKEAGIKDWWESVSTPRGAALKGWEKRMPQYVKKLRRDTEKMINKSEVMLNTMLGSLKALANARGKRQLEEYVKIAEGVTKKYDQYDVLFNDFYQEHIDKLVKQKQEIDAMSEGATETSSEEVSESSPEVAAVPSSAKAPAGGGPEFLHRDEFADLVMETEEAVKTPPQNGGAGDPISFSKVKQVTNDAVLDPNLNPEIANTMVDLEQQMGFEPEPRHSSKHHAAPLSESIDVEFTQRVPAAPATQRVPGTLRLAPATHKQPEAPHTLIPSTHVTPSTGNRHTSRAPGTLNLHNPTFPKPAAVPTDLAQWMPPAPDTEQWEPENPHTEKEPSTVRSRTAADKFIEELTASAEESPIVLANKIIKFANSMGNSDKTTSDKLLSIAKNILSNV